jgi:hypothetical protein
VKTNSIGIYRLKGTISVIGGIAILLEGCSKNLLDQTHSSTSSLTPKPLQATESSTFLSSNTMDCQNVPINHPSDKESLLPASIAFTPAEVVNLGVVNVSVEKTNWFNLGVNRSCGITVVTDRLILDRIVVKFVILTTNISVDTRLPQVTVETARTMLMPNQVNAFSLGHVLFSLTPTLGAFETNQNRLEKGE